MTLQDASKQAVIDYWQYTMIFNEAEAGENTDKKAADKSNENGGAQMPLTRATMPLKSFLPRKA